MSKWAEPTALRYIRQAEAPTGEKQAAAMGTPQQAEQGRDHG